MEPWLFTALWTGVGFFVVFLVLVSTSEPLNDVRAERDLALLDEFRAKDSSTKVVIIGNSKLRYATFPENELDDAASRMGLGAAFVRLLSNNAVFEHFDYALDKLLDLQPDIIVIQAPLLVREPSKHLSRFHFFQQYVRWRLVGGTIDGVDPHETQRRLICNHNVSDQMHEDYRERIERQRRYDPKGDNAKSATEFLESARERDIQVVAVTVPVTTKLESYLDATGDLAMIRDHALPRTEESWVFPLELADDMFCDPMHLGPEGREIYSMWLVERVANWRNANQDDLPALNIMESS